MSHTIKIQKRVFETRLRREVTVSEQLYGFTPRKSTIVLMDKYRENKELQCVFVDPKKAYDSVSREELRRCMWESGWQKSM